MFYTYNFIACDLLSQFCAEKLYQYAALYRLFISFFIDAVNACIHYQS
jgi:hypothetical protein